MGGLIQDGSVASGSLMTGSITYDTDAIAENLPPEFNGAGAIPVDSLVLSIGNYTFVHDPAALDSPTFSVWAGDFNYQAYSHSGRFEGVITADGVTKTYEDINWVKRDVVLLSLCTLDNGWDYRQIPTSPEMVPPASLFDYYNRFYVYFEDDTGRYFSLAGEITSMELVPEPATVLLLGLGGLVLRKRRGVRRVGRNR